MELCLNSDETKAHKEAENPILSHRWSNSFPLATLLSSLSLKHLVVSFSYKKDLWRLLSGGGGPLEKGRFLSALWASVSVEFKDCTFSSITLDWKAAVVWVRYVLTLILSLEFVRYINYSSPSVVVFGFVLFCFLLLWTCPKLLFLGSVLLFQ